MPDVELEASVRDGHVVVVLRGELDVTGAADAEAAITALVDDRFWVHASVAAAAAGVASRRRRYPWQRLAVRTARPGRAVPSRTGAG